VAVTFAVATLIFAGFTLFFYEVRRQEIDDEDELNSEVDQCLKDPSSPAASTATVREWAKSQGIAVMDRGAISKRVVKLYQDCGCPKRCALSLTWCFTAERPTA
jgi:hypothetical protein